MAGNNLNYAVMLRNHAHNSWIAGTSPIIISLGARGSVWQLNPCKVVFLAMYLRRVNGYGDEARAFSWIRIAWIICVLPASVREG